MAEQRIEVKTRGRTCPGHDLHRAGDRPAPAVILCSCGRSASGQAMRAMAERLASNGFFGLLPNMY
jgi:dienelactone hydrolase